MTFAADVCSSRMPDGSRGYSIVVFITADDFRPMAWRTHDYGKTWTAIATWATVAPFASAICRSSSTSNT